MNLWVCPKCFRVNPNTCSLCLDCGTPRPVGPDDIEKRSERESQRGRRTGSRKPYQKRKPKKGPLIGLAVAAAVILAAVLIIMPPRLKPPPSVPPVETMDFSARSRVFGVTAPAVMLVEADTGAILYQRHPDQKVLPASTTKLMTLLLGIEAIENKVMTEDDRAMATENAWLTGGSRIYLEPGEKLTFRDLFKAIAVVSANDACVAVAEALANTTDHFVGQMNEKARQLGMSNTHYANVNGLPIDNHYTTARDMTILAREVVRHPKIFNYTSIKESTIRDGKFPVKSTNDLLWWYEGSDGLKTGWTTEAKYCVVATAKRNDMRLIASVFASPQPKENFRDAIRLFDFGFSRFTWPTLAAKGEPCGKVNVWFGKDSSVTVVADGNAGYLTRKGSEAEITFKKTLVSRTNAPVKKGEKLGYIEVYNTGRLVKVVNLTAAKDVPRWFQ